MEGNYPARHGPMPGRPSRSFCRRRSHSMSKLLVVDDEPLICQSFRWVFNAEDVEVTTAGTLAEGWTRVEKDRPDVVVLDLQLPDGSGLELFERLRKMD